MILYHGGPEIVETPVVRPSTGRDFGAGFYLTSLQDQAKKWAFRQARVNKKDSAFQNVYVFDEQSALENLKIKNFTDYSMEWLDLVLKCRKDKDFRHEYDIVFGKIADDDVGETVQAVLDGLMPRDFAVQKLSFMKTNDQYCFCTEAALGCLHYKEARRLK